jgi:hypothetical protein
VAETNVPLTGRYLFRFQYRVGSKRQTAESIRVSIGNRSFEFEDTELKNSNRWEWSPNLEVGLSAGKVPIEFLSIGKDSVHLERIRLERVCECGGASSPPN